MRTTTRANMCAMAALMAAIGAGLAALPVQAQVGQGEADGLIGSWQVTISVTNPPGFASFPVLMTYFADGNLLQSRLSYIPSFGVLETTAHGGWQRNRNQISATTYALSQGAPGNAALNGAFFGTEKVNFNPVIGPTGNTFTAAWTSTVYDPSGNPIIGGNGTMTGVRAPIGQ